MTGFAAAVVASTAAIVGVAVVLSAGPDKGLAQGVGDVAGLLAAVVAVLACARAARRSGPDAREWTPLAVAVGIYFSVVQRKVVTPNDFTALDQIRDRLAAFEDRYNAVVKPCSWKFTRTDLDDLLHRMDAHQTQPAERLAA